MSRWKNRVVCAVAGLGLLAFAPSAAADGTCGHHNDNGPEACPIASSGGYSGSLVPAYDPSSAFWPELDYYVFYARAGTAVVMTLNNAEDPSCSTAALLDCGEVYAKLDNSDGDSIANSMRDGGFGGAKVIDGIPVPASLTVTLDRAGTYYLIISGPLGSDFATPAPTDLAVPYTFALTGTPDVQWPPPCTVPRVSRKLKLAGAEKLLIGDGCKLGTITRKRSRRVPPGDVIGFRPAPGTVLAGQAPVGVVVSRSHRAGHGHRRGKHH